MIDIEPYKEKVIDLVSDVSSIPGPAVARKVMSMTGEKGVSDTKKSRIIHSALGGLFALASSPLLSKFLFKTKVGKVALATDVMTGAATGYFTPKVINLIAKERRGEISKEEFNKRAKDIHKITSAADHSFMMSKDAGFISSVGKRFSKGVWGAIREGARFQPKKGMHGYSRGKRLWGNTFKVGVPAAGAYGIYGFNKKHSGTVKPNYTTFLRNQVLAGNVTQSEMSQPDLKSVRKLGL